MINADTGLSAGNRNLSKAIGRFTTATLPAASAVPSGSVAYVTGVLTNRDVVMQSDGTWWKPYGGQQLLYIGTGEVTLTGVAAETLMDEYALPAKLMSPKLQIRIGILTTSTNSTNSKRQRLRLGGIAGTAYSDLSYFSATAYGSSYEVAITVGATINAQSGPSSAMFTAPLGTFSTAHVTSALDLSASDVKATFSGQVASAGETIVLKQMTVRIIG